MVRLNLRQERQVEFTQKHFGVHTDLETMQKVSDTQYWFQVCNFNGSTLQNVSSRLLCVMSPLVEINLDDLPGNQYMTGEENQWGATYMVRHLGFGQGSCAIRSWSSGFGSKLNWRSVIPTVNKKKGFLGEHTMIDRMRYCIFGSVLFEYVSS